MKKIYVIGSDRLLSDVSIDKQNQIIKVGSVDQVPNGETLLSLHSANTVELIANDYKKAILKNIDFIGCNDTKVGILNNKGETKTLFGKLGFPVAKGYNLKGSKEIIEKVINTYNFNFPVLIKEVTNTGGLGIYVLRTLEDMEKLELNPLGDYVLEEFIEGDEYSCMLFIHNGKIITFNPIIKGKTGINEKGEIIHSLQKTRTNITTKENAEKIRIISESIGKIDGINGFLDFDFIIDNNGNAKILEINPRVSGITDISFLGADFGIDDLIDFISGKSEIEGSFNLLNNKIAVEYPIIFDNPDFNEKDFSNISGGKIIKTTCLRKFPPYTQKVLFEFDSELSFKNFIENNI